MLSPDEFYPLMRVLDKAYPRFALDEETTEVYYQVLGDLPLEAIKAAIVDWISSDTPWCPAAGQIRARAFSLVENDEERMSAGEAWAEVCKQVRDVGHWGDPEFSSLLIHQAVDAVGGWRYVCLTPEEMMFTTRARFASAYETLQQRQRNDARMLPQVREAIQSLAAGMDVKQLEE